MVVVGGVGAGAGIDAGAVEADVRGGWVDVDAVAAAGLPESGGDGAGAADGEQVGAAVAVEVAVGAAAGAAALNGTLAASPKLPPEVWAVTASRLANRVGLMVKVALPEVAVTVTGGCSLSWYMYAVGVVPFPWVTVTVAFWPIVLPDDTLTVGAPGRLGSKKKLQAADHEVVTNPSVICTCQENCVTAVPAAPLSRPSSTTRTAVCPEG